MTTAAKGTAEETTTEQMNPLDKFRNSLWATLCGELHIKYPAFLIFTLWFITITKLQLGSSNVIIL